MSSAPFGFEFQAENPNSERQVSETLPSQAANSSRPQPVVPPPLPPRKSGSGASQRRLPRPSGTSPAVSEGRPQPWQMPEPYKLVRPLSLKGLAFEAQNLTTGRRLFVRLYSDIHQLHELVQRFEGPSQLVSSHSVRVVDIGMVDLPVPIGYSVMEFIEGPSIQAVLEERGVLALHVGLRLATQVLASLEEAHRRGLSHGSVSPKCVLLGRGTLGEPVAKLYGYQATPVVVSESPGLEAVSRDLAAVAQLLCFCLFGRSLSLVDSPENRRALVAMTVSSPGLAEILFSALGWGAFQYQSATQFGSALARLPVTSAAGKRRGLSVLDSAAVGASESVRDIFPSRLRESSLRPLVIWVLADDPALALEANAFALEELTSVCEVRTLTVTEQATVREQVAKGDIPLPWVVLFGESHVERAEPLLALLAASRELSRLLVCSSEDVEAVRRAARFCGIDGCFTRSSSTTTLTHEVARLAERTRAKCRGFDGVRRDLRATLDEVGELSRAAAAEDIAEVPSSRSWSVRGFSHNAKRAS
jgi:hypothetical protein